MFIFITMMEEIPAQIKKINENDKHQLTAREVYVPWS